MSEAEREAPPRAEPTSRVVQGKPLADASVTAIIHYYRAEVSRGNAWRTRMDATTNWAIGATTALLSFTYSTPSSPPLLIQVGGVLIFLLMCIEGRRYRFYDVWRSRTRLMEAHLMVPYLLPEHSILQGDWRERLAEDLILPTYKMSMWVAIGRRLRRNYVWLFLILLLGWVFKLFLHSPRNQSFLDVYHELAVGPLPSWLVLGGTAAFYVLLTYWFFSAGRSDDPEVLVYKRIRGETRPWPI